MVRAGTDLTAQSFVLTVLKTVVLTIAVVSALSQLGIDTASVLASLGVVGLTLGFAAKDALSNIISGVFIFLDRPFVIGDLVEIGGNYGRVEKITMRSTRVVTVDGKMLAIPNTVIVNTTVTSYTNFPHLRLDIPLTVGLDEDYGKIAELMLSVAKQHQQFLPDPAPAVVIKAVKDYNVEVELQVWIDDETQHVATRFDLRRRLYEALRSAKIVMPYETLQLQPVEVRWSAPSAQ
jgi:small conductance mechanosensitive channel